MTAGFRAPLGALLVLILTAGSACAGMAVLSTDMIAREGPGDEFKPVWNVVAGTQVDVRQCNLHQWCLIEHRGKQGWVHVRQVDADVGHASAPASSDDSASADQQAGDSAPADEQAGSETPKAGGDRSRPGGNNFVADVPDPTPPQLK